MVNPLNIDLNPTDPNLAPLARLNITGVARSTLQGLLIFASVAFVVYLLWGGYKWISSGGDKEGVSKASKRITSALIGLILTFSVFGITGILAYSSDINLFCVEVPGIGMTLGSCPGLASSIPSFPDPTPLPTNTPIPGTDPNAPSPTPSQVCYCDGEDTTTCRAYGWDERACISNPQCSCRYFSPTEPQCLCDAPGHPEDQLRCDQFTFDRTACENDPICACHNTVYPHPDACNCNGPSNSCISYTNRAACISHAADGCHCQYTLIPDFYQIRAIPYCANGANPSGDLFLAYSLAPLNGGYFPDTPASGVHTMDIPESSVTGLQGNPVYLQMALSPYTGRVDSLIPDPSRLPPNAEAVDLWGDGTNYFVQLNQQDDPSGNPATPQGDYDIYFLAPPSRCILPTPTLGPNACYTDSDCPTAQPICNSTTDSDRDSYYPAPLSGNSGICRNRSLDCNDSNASVYPSQTAYFSTPIPGTTDNFDYNCDSINTTYPNYSCLSDIGNLRMCSSTPLGPAMLSRSGWIDHIPLCGEALISPSNQFITCHGYAESMCLPGAGGYPSAGSIRCNAPCPAPSSCPNNTTCISWQLEPRLPFRTDLLWDRMACH